mmetsp:Transcript_33271/g.82882  ORF Transcript_33271/g.82882 Transcript_33271/m.82882 type:complete len:84 (-) Transcript_33271:60-311(-)
MVTMVGADAVAPADVADAAALMDAVDAAVVAATAAKWAVGASGDKVSSSSRAPATCRHPPPTVYIRSRRMAPLMACRQHRLAS